LEHYKTFWDLLVAVLYLSQICSLMMRHKNGWLSVVVRKYFCRSQMVEGAVMTFIFDVTFTEKCYWICNDLPQLKNAHVKSYLLLVLPINSQFTNEVPIFFVEILFKIKRFTVWLKSQFLFKWAFLYCTIPRELTGSLDENRLKSPQTINF